MAQVRPRSSSPTVDKVHHKRPKTSHTASDDTDADSDVVAHFATSLFDPSNVERLRTGYVDSAPFKHVVVDTLFRDDLLRSVKDECIEHLSFTEKETDIYKVWRATAIRRATHPLIRSLARSTKQATSPPFPTSPTTNAPSSRTSSPSAMPSIPPASVPFFKLSQAAVLSRAKRKTCPSIRTPVAVTSSTTTT